MSYKVLQKNIYLKKNHVIRRSPTTHNNNIQTKTNFKLQSTKKTQPTLFLNIIKSKSHLNSSRLFDTGDSEGQSFGLPVDFENQKWSGRIESRSYIPPYPSRPIGHRALSDVTRACPVTDFSKSGCESSDVSFFGFLQDTNFFFSFTWRLPIGEYSFGGCCLGSRVCSWDD